MSGRPRTTSFAEGKTQPNPVMGGMKISSKYWVYIKLFLYWTPFGEGLFDLKTFFVDGHLFKDPVMTWLVSNISCVTIALICCQKLCIHCGGRHGLQSLRLRILAPSFTIALYRICSRISTCQSIFLFLHRYINIPYIYIFMWMLRTLCANIHFLRLIFSQYLCVQ